MYTKQQLLEAGEDHIKKWMELNNIPSILINKWYPGQRMYYLKTCGLFMAPHTFGDGRTRPASINIMPDKCQHVDSGSVGGRNWSYPGYVIDQTPYGVLAHELGHYVDYITGRPWTLSAKLRLITKEKAITNYKKDDDTEWFAEIFRLFVTNPSLLNLIRPRMFKELYDRFPFVVEQGDWFEVLKHAPARTKEMIYKKIPAQTTLDENEMRHR